MKGLWVLYNLELNEGNKFRGSRSNLLYVSVFVLGINDEVAIVSGERVLVEVGALPGGSGGDALVLVVDVVDGGLEGFTLDEVETADHGRVAERVVVDVLEAELALEGELGLSEDLVVLLVDEERVGVVVLGVGSVGDGDEHVLFGSHFTDGAD